MNKEEIIDNIIKLQEQYKDISDRLKESKEMLQEIAEPWDKFDSEAWTVTVFTQTRNKIKEWYSEADLAERVPKYKEIKLNKDFYSDLEAEEYIDTTSSISIRIKVKEPF